MFPVSESVDAGRSVGSYEKIGCDALVVVSECLKTGKKSDLHLLVEIHVYGSINNVISVGGHVLISHIPPECKEGPLHGYLFRVSPIEVGNFTP